MEIVDGRRRTDGRTTGHGHPISSLFEPKGSCELKLVYPCILKFCCIKCGSLGIHGHVILIWITDHARDDLNYVKTL